MGVQSVITLVRPNDQPEDHPYPEDIQQLVNQAYELGYRVEWEDARWAWDRYSEHMGVECMLMSPRPTSNLNVLLNYLEVVR